MRKVSILLLLALGLCLAPLGQVQADPITVSDPLWYEFAFGLAPSFATEGSGTVPSSGGNSQPAPDPAWTYFFPSGTRLTVADAFIEGDIFTVYDFGVAIGYTTFVANTGINSGTSDPAVALGIAGLSKGFFSLLPGAHSITIEVVQNALGTLTHHVRSVVEEQLEVRDSLLTLLHLIIENVGELSEDDRWLRGQIDGLLASITPPLTLRHLDEMERRMRDVIEKQGRAKARSVSAQQELRHMLAEFVESLAVMNQSSSEFEAKIEESARQIESVTSADELKSLLENVITATHAMAEESASSREQLKSLQAKVEVTEAELLQLHQELDSASALARHDPLTDALNRKGLDEALLREISSMRRKETPLSVSLLDIDNFKKLNDSLGHDVGDSALVHLADVTRRHIRPSDTLARYGGEEFVILMPDTVLEDGIEVITRLQRELTKAIFMAGNDKLLITFSAGVAQVGAEESGNDAIRRADQAMYLAKRAGKNRVMGG